jgi:hypothetical protein
MDLFSFVALYKYIFFDGFVWDTLWWDELEEQVLQFVLVRLKMVLLQPFLILSNGTFYKTINLLESSTN